MNFLLQSIQKQAPKPAPKQEHKQNGHGSYKKMITNPLIDMPEYCENPKYNGRNLTNRVFKEEYSNGQKTSITYYCPVYMRVELKNFAQLNHEDLGATVNMTILITFNFRGISPLIQSKIRQMLKLTFNRDNALKIQQDSQSTSMKIEDCGVYTYSILKMVHVAMDPDIFMSPFQKIYLVMSVSLQSIQINHELIKEMIEQAKYQKRKINQTIKEINQKDKHIKQNQIFDSQQLKNLRERRRMLETEASHLNSLNAIHVKFNFMDTQDSFSKISYTAEGTFGNYDLAQSLISSEFTFKSTPKRMRDQLKKKQQNKKRSEVQVQKIDYSIVKPFNYAHFSIPLYKYPLVTIMKIFLPLWLLGIINMGIFFQNVGLGDRIGSMSGLLIAFVALIPVIREELPQSPSVALVQILVYTQTFSTILCFIQSMNVRNLQDYQFDWTTNVFFLISLAIQILEILMVTLMMFAHKIYFEPSYNNTQKVVVKFDYLKWENSVCDNHFKRKLENSSISKFKIIKVDKNLEKTKDHLVKLEEQQKTELIEVYDNEEPAQEMSKK